MTRKKKEYTLEDILNQSIELEYVELYELGVLKVIQMEKLYIQVLNKMKENDRSKVRTDLYWKLRDALKDDPKKPMKNEETGDTLLDHNLQPIYHALYPSQKRSYKIKRLLVACYIAYRDDLEIDLEYELDCLELTEQKEPGIQPNLNFYNEGKV